MSVFGKNTLHKRTTLIVAPLIRVGPILESCVSKSNNKSQYGIGTCDSMQWKQINSECYISRVKQFLFVVYIGSCFGYLV